MFVSSTTSTTSTPSFNSNSTNATTQTPPLFSVETAGSIANNSTSTSSFSWIA